jgi:protein-tyrosine phosphatase
LWTGHIGRYPELSTDTRAAIVEARAAYLDAAFEAVREDFADPERFAEGALGLDHDTLERLRGDLLE